MTKIQVEVWLYGPLAQYADEGGEGSYARFDQELPVGSRLKDLLRRLELPAEERGIIFVSGNLAAVPGVETDLALTLKDGDRVGIFHKKSMWPMQYRFGAQVTPELEHAFRERKDRGLRHAYTAGDVEE